MEKYLTEKIFELKVALFLRSNKILKPPLFLGEFAK